MYANYVTYSIMNKCIIKLKCSLSYMYSTYVINMKNLCITYVCYSEYHIYMYFICTLVYMYRAISELYVLHMCYCNKYV